MLPSYYFRKLPFAAAWTLHRRRNTLVPLAVFLAEPMDYVVLKPVLQFLPPYVLVAKNLITGEEKKIDQKITSNVLQFFTQEGTKISVRPSGTEPKIKFYFEVKGELKSRADFDAAEQKADAKIDAIMEEMKQLEKDFPPICTA